MRRKFFILPIVLFYSLRLLAATDTLRPATKAEYIKASETSPYRKYDEVKKVKYILKVAPCLTFKDDETDEKFTEYDFQGCIDSLARYRIVRRMEYNGNSFIIVDVKNGCKQYDLPGKPHLFGKYIICFNEAETTDRKLYFELWMLTEKGLVKQRTIRFSGNRYFTVRQLGMAFIFRDENGQYWKI